MGLTEWDTWGHFSPMFHLVDAFGIYSLTMVGGKHILLPHFTPQAALKAIGRDSSLKIPMLDVRCWF